MARRAGSFRLYVCLVPQVLIVDDDPDLREALADCLLDAGISVVTAADGFEGLERLREGPVDVILLDVLMPGMDGQEFLAHCRRMPRVASVPVIVSTGLSLATVSGADVRLDKPFDLEELLEAVRRCLELDSRDVSTAS